MSYTSTNNEMVNEVDKLIALDLQADTAMRLMGNFYFSEIQLQACRRAKQLHYNAWYLVYTVPALRDFKLMRVTYKLEKKGMELQSFSL